MNYTRAASLLLGLLPVLSASAGTFTFDAPELLLTSTPFSSTSDGINAAFSSPDGGAFFVAPVDRFIISTLSGQLLQDTDPLLHRLDIVFDTPLQSFSMLFAMAGDWTTDSMSLEAWLGSTLVGSTSATGTVQIPGGLPEGSLMFTAGIFDSVRITSSAINFAIDDVEVTRFSPVPEPATFVFSLSSLAALLLFGRRLRSN